MADPVSEVVSSARTIPSPPQIADWEAQAVFMKARIAELAARRTALEREKVNVGAEPGKIANLDRIKKEEGALRDLVHLYEDFTIAVQTEASERQRIDLIASGKSLANSVSK